MERTTNRLYDIFLKRGIQLATPRNPGTPKRKRSPSEPMICGTPVKRPTAADNSPARRPRVMSCSNIGGKKGKRSNIAMKDRPRTQSVGQKSIKELFFKKCDKSEDSN